VAREEDALELQVGARLLSALRPSPVMTLISSHCAPPLCCKRRSEPRIVDA
jgi:hypothetical protein